MQIFDKFDETIPHVVIAWSNGCGCNHWFIPKGSLPLQKLMAYGAWPLWLVIMPLR